MPPGQIGVIEQAKFTYSPLVKAFEKQIKTIENQGEKQIKALQEHGKQLTESNALVKKMIMILKITYFLRKKKYMIKLLLKK